MYFLSNGNVADILHFRCNVADILNSELSNENKASITLFERRRIPVVFFIDRFPLVDRFQLSLNEGMYEYEYNVWA